MRASSLLILALIAAAAEHPLLIIGVDGKCNRSIQQTNFGKIPDNISVEENGRFRMPCKDGYVRKAGTSNLFACRKNLTGYFWENRPSLECIEDPNKRQALTVANTQAHATTPNPTPAPSTPGTTKTSYYTTPEKTQSTSAASGSTAFTTSHTVATTTGTSFHTSLRTTAQEEEPMTTTSSSIARPTSASFTGTENLTTVSTQPSVISTTTTTTITTTTTTCTEKESQWDTVTGGIAAGTVLMLIVVTASAAGLFLWCRRSSQREVRMEMALPPGSDLPLINPSSSLKTCSDSVQCTLLENSAQNLQIDA